MTEYEIQRLNGAGAITARANAMCASDEEACALARRMSAPMGDAEVWLGSRLVCRVSAARTTTMQSAIFGGNDPLGESFAARLLS